jgi:large subunit ribosomal protein L29
MMKASQFRDMSVEDLEAEVVSLSEQLFKLRFQMATGQLENVMKFRGVRKDLARVKTVINEKRRASAES